MRFLTYFSLGTVSGALLWLILSYSLLGTPSDSTGGIYQTYEYKRKLLQTSSAPRIIFVGGSGTLMGIGADIIHQQLLVPTINFGIYAGLDLDYQLHLLKNCLQSGDIVVFSFEYAAYTNLGDEVSANTRDYLIERDKEYFLNQPITQQLEQLFTIGPGGLTKMVMSFIVPSLTRTRLYPIELLNEYGDQTVNRRSDSNNLFKNAISNYKPLELSAILNKSNRSWGVLRDFIEQARMHKQITFYATFPNTLYFEEYSGQAFKSTINRIEAFYQGVSVPMLGTAEEFMYPQDYFYDSNYHLNQQGVMVRSKALATILQQRDEIKRLQIKMAIN